MINPYTERGYDLFKLYLRRSEQMSNLALIQIVMINIILHCDVTGYPAYKWTAGMAELFFYLGLYLFCLGLTSLLYIWGHIATVPTCSSGTLTNVLPHKNVMPQTHDMTPHPVTVYIHGANQSLFYPLMWDGKLEYTPTHFYVFGKTRSGNPVTSHYKIFTLLYSENMVYMDTYR